jgi:hypothetical protein
LSLRWLVERLGDLWFNETGEIVTSNAIKGGDYSGIPQSAAGRFITATVEAMQPSKAWLAEREAMAYCDPRGACRASSGPSTAWADYVARLRV